MDVCSFHIFNVVSEHVHVYTCEGNYCAHILSVSHKDYSLAVCVCVRTISLLYMCVFTLCVCSIISPCARCNVYEYLCVCVCVCVCVLTPMSVCLSVYTHYVTVYLVLNKYPCKLHVSRECIYAYACMRMQACVC